MMTEIMRADWNQRENEITSEQVLACIERVDTQRAQKVLIWATKENKKTIILWKAPGKKPNKSKASRREACTNCNYCGNAHEPLTDAACGKSSSWCNRAKNIIKKNAASVFYKEKEQLYLEIDASGFGLDASLLQDRDGM